ncbi:hypothetical protein [Alteromonas gracilis]|uniref:hypothetical protein n=1 Tax=Alteromonas gracilis TaxID=1479524 RepID=UPI003736E24C
MPVQVKAFSLFTLYQRAFGFAHVRHGLMPLLAFIALLFLPNLALASAVNQPVSVFSTYPSESLLQSCKLHAEPHRSVPEKNSRSHLCFEDSISPESFITLLGNSGVFRQLFPYGEGSDYELLIANVGTTPSEHKQHAKQFAEFTLQWRGIEIDSSSFDASPDLSTKDGTQLITMDNEAHVLVTRWLEYAEHSGLFTSQFLFAALEASNYDKGLMVPSAVGEFTKLDTQLFADPFSGAITRYTHAAFEDALVDVTVYPFLGQLTLAENELLPQQLESDLQKATATADMQRLKLSQVSPASRYEVNSNLAGWRLGLSAASETSPTIYATTYVFKLQDKIVKISTTFPPEFSDNIVNQLIVAIKVPHESEMMKKVRSLLLESTH